MDNISLIRGIADSVFTNYPEESENYVFLYAELLRRAKNTVSHLPETELTFLVNKVFDEYLFA